jgi:DNA ligase 1
MQELAILSQIANVSGKNDKRALLKANANDQRLQDLLDAALNYKRRYYIKKWEEITPFYQVEIDQHDTFMKLLSDLESQKYRGDAATNMVTSFLFDCSGIQREWYSRILRKDLKAGFSVDSAIDCGFDIPLFEVQLAKDGYECKKLDQMIKAGLSASRKYDGYRCFAVVHNGEVALYTRNGEIFHNFPGVEESLLQICGAGSYVFDGEIMSNNFQGMQKSAFASKRRTVVGDMVYHIFDMIPYEEWETKQFKTLAFDRYANLDAFINANPMPNLKVVERVMVSDRQHLLDLELVYILDGYEGVMANPNIPYYTGKKSNKMLKFKQFKSMDCKIMSAYKGDPLSKYKDTLGGFTVEQENGVLCDVGGGYDDAERDEMWKDQTIIGRIMEVKYQNLTEDDKKMRFPVFVRFRDMGTDRGKM